MFPAPVVAFCDLPPGRDIRVPPVSDPDRPGRVPMASPKFGSVFSAPVRTLFTGRSVHWHPPLASTYYILKAGIAPPDLADHPPAVKMMFWRWVVDLGLRVKDRELSQGLNAKGKPLPPISRKTRKHRRSSMTSSGRGDPSAPYLMPGRGLSRTRSLLTGKAHESYAEFWWKYDAFTGDSWAKILSYHARRGEAYNVIGLSPRGVSAVASQAQAKWRAWKGGTIIPQVDMTRKAPPVRMKVPGKTNLEHTTFGIGASKDEVQRAIDEGRFSGFMTADEWKKHWRSKAPVPRLADESTTSYSVRRGKSNVLLQHVWGEYQPVGKVIPMVSKLDRAVITLVESLRVNPDYTVNQLIALVGDAQTAGEAVLEAMRRKLIIVAVDDAGKIIFRVVG
jgi:hypothetical protein